MKQGPERCLIYFISDPGFLFISKCAEEYIGKKGVHKFWQIFCFVLFLFVGGGGYEWAHTSHLSSFCAMVILWYVLKVWLILAA